MPSDHVIGEAIRDLSLAFGKPFGTDGQTQQAIAVWKRALEGCDDFDLRAAVAELTRTGRKYPTPSELRRIADARRARRARPSAHVEDVYCQRCLTPSLYVAPNDRLRILHAETCPIVHDDDLTEIRWAREYAEILTIGVESQPLTPPARGPEAA